ncbi:unnamed protein product [Cuscuta epithymum]|uniref:CID domain-containing protein n=1 Tax=Cuscuta epithymum TaxID=186058 RepID=A0AAV0C592_9ASTE|nr:unnamed protein product [Cuscuta epithymum]
MGDEPFDGKALTEKLSKLNGSQQCIESLSRWCTSFRKKAKQIVETWDKLFKSAQKEQRVAFLYLANDILQNSRRKGNEFVNEFWKVLPAALKDVFASGHEQEKKVASRLVDIWEERKVFGSRGQILKDELLVKGPPLLGGNVKSVGKSPLSVSNAINPNPIKVIKRDTQSLRIKLAIGEVPERIITAFQVLYDECTNEEGALNKCKDALFHFKEMENDIANVFSQGTPQGSEMLDKIQEQENVLKQCVTQLESVEASRTSLISKLKEAADNQENKLEQLRSDLKAARMQIEQAADIIERFKSSPVLHPTIEEAARTSETSPYPVIPLPTNLPPVSSSSFATLKSTTDEESSKRAAAAAAVAAKLTASTSSAQMLTSVLSSLVAEEAAAASASALTSSSALKRGPGGFSSNLPEKKRLTLDNPAGASLSSENNVDGGNSSSTPYFCGTISQFSSPPPPPPPIPPPNSVTSPLVQSAAMIMGGLSYGYASAGPPPPLHLATGLTRLPPLQPPQQPTQQSVNGGGYYPPPGFGFYGQSPQTPPPPPPVPRH